MTKWAVKRWEQIYQAAHAKGGAGITRKEVAEALGLAKTAYLRGILHSMVAAGYLVEKWDDDRPHPAFVYVPADMQKAA
jgi:DNA-binding IclR family transcriptional regulator